VSRIRFSIGWLMIVVAVAAFEFTALRISIRSGTNFAQAILITFPMLNLLTIGLVLIRRRRGQARAFLVGFETFGWLAVVASVLDCFGGFPCLQMYASTCAPFLDSFANELGIGTGSEIWRDENSAAYWLVAVPLELAFCLPPQLVPALIGGWLSLRYRVRITIERRRPTEPEVRASREPGGFVLPDEGLVPGMASE
jgi:hypothetical protein